jgi:uncharacterized protein
MKELFKELIRESQKREFSGIRERELQLPEINKVISIIGPRRCGKSSFFFSLIEKLRKKVDRENIFYINFDDDRLFPLQLNDMQWIITAFYELYPKKKEEIVYVFFDEIQEIPNWEKFIRRIYDTEQIRIFISGSSSSLLETEIGSALRGRTFTYRLFPLSFREFLTFHDIEPDPYTSVSQAKIGNAFDQFLNWGGFPETLYVGEENKQKLLQEYLNMTLLKDITERFNVQNYHLLKFVFYYSIKNSASLLSINHIHQHLKSLGMQAGLNTLHEYFSYFNDCLSVFQVPKYTQNMREQQRNPKKIYSVDNGFIQVVSLKQDKGRLFENCVFDELIKKTDKIFYFKGKQEVDFVYLKDNQPVLINVAYDISDPATQKREKDGLVEAMKSLNIRQSVLLSNTVEGEWETESGKIKLIPLWKWLITENK